MKLNKTTRYALYAAMEMARAWPDKPVTVAEVAARFKIPVTALAKAFQQLVRAGLANGTRGVGGGYRLSASPSEVTALDVIHALEPESDARRCLVWDGPGECHSLDGCSLRRLFDEVEDLARATFASTSLETLVTPRRPEGQRPAPSS